MKVLIVMGTRPEVIKLAPVVFALRAAAIETIVCASGQHKEMLEQSMTFFGITPDVSLDTMRAGQSLNALAARLVSGLDEVIAAISPDWVLVQGDTTTAFCAGFAAFQLGIAVGHIEAGLRTGNLQSPFPEEANRSLLSRIASWHFAPTRRSRQNLLDEGIAADRIVVTGNTVVDAIGLVRESWKTTPPADPLPAWTGKESSHVLVTCHRRENFGDVLDGICRVLRDLCARYPEYRWVFPVHLNPAVRAPVMRELGGIANLQLLDPVDYPTSLDLIRRSVLVLSDSGGIQEEAPTFGVPAVVMRNHTERREGVDAGFATLAGQSAHDIEQAAIAWLDDPSRRQTLRERANPYGDGLASKRIADTLSNRRVEAFGG